MTDYAYRGRLQGLTAWCNVAAFTMGRKEEGRAALEKEEEEEKDEGVEEEEDSGDGDLCRSLGTTTSKLHDEAVSGASPQGGAKLPLAGVCTGTETPSAALSTLD